MWGTTPLYEVPVGNHGRQDKYPIEDDEYNYHDSLRTEMLRWLKTVMFPWDAWVLTRTSARAIRQSPEGQRDIARYSWVFTFIRQELRALLSSGPSSRVRKVGPCNFKILIWAYNAR